MKKPLDADFYFSRLSASFAGKINKTSFRPKPTFRFPGRKIFIDISAEFNYKVKTNSRSLHPKRADRSLAEQPLQIFSKTLEFSKR
jgi:hypothetical protein